MYSTVLYIRVDTFVKANYLCSKHERLRCLFMEYGMLYFDYYINFKYLRFYLFYLHAQQASDTEFPSKSSSKESVRQSNPLRLKIMSESSNTFQKAMYNHYPCNSISQ